MSNRRIRLIVAYDGTDFCGFAAQAGRRTVQGTLKEAVCRISGKECEIEGASRTDSGAHARGQVCHFDTELNLGKRWPRVLNDLLPLEVRVQSCVEVAPDFNSRFYAKHRTYEYRVLVGTQDPHRLRFAHFEPKPLDIDAMSEAAKLLVGKHDFRAFSEELSKEVLNTVRTIHSARVKALRDEVRIEVVGSAFVRGMMRRIAGALCEVGRGKRSLDSVTRLLNEPVGTEHRPVVLPARGLTLVRVTYGRHPKDNRNKTALDNEETGLE